MQNRKECFYTGRAYPLHKHHIYAGKNRQISEQNGFWVWLIPELHNMSGCGVHSDKELDLQLKQICQRKYEETHSRADFIKLIGRNYL